MDISLPCDKLPWERGMGFLAGKDDMKDIIIQDYAHRRFYGAGQNWIQNPHRALHFDTSVHAADYAINHHLQDLSVLSYTSEQAATYPQKPHRTSTSSG